MGRKRLPPDEQKISKSVRLKRKVWKELEKLGGYNRIIEKLVNEFLKIKKK